jgi:hypothetical protein
MPECLPEQLLCNAVGSRPAACKALAASALNGAWMPQCSASSLADLFEIDCSCHLTWLAGMRSGHHRELGVGETEAIGSAAFHQRQQLKRLGARAEIRHQIGIARLRDQFPVCIHHSNHAAMFRLHSPAARHFNQWYCFKHSHS